MTFPCAGTPADTDHALVPCIAPTVHAGCRPTGWLLWSGPERTGLLPTETVAPHRIVSILTSGGTKTVTANESIVRQIEGHLVDFGNWRSRALHDNRISDDELADGLPILDRLIDKVSELTFTVNHVQNCFNGADGMFSVRADRGWKEAHRKRENNLVMFPLRSDNESQQSGD